eukprot:892699_1
MVSLPNAFDQLKKQPVSKKKPKTTAPKEKKKYTKSNNLQMKHNLHPNARNIMEFDQQDSNLNSKMFYVTVDGKQHGAMRRWIRHFDSMNGLIWIVDLCTFNEYIYPDTNDAEEKYDAKKLYSNTNTQNKLKHDIEIFEQVVYHTSQWFRNTTKMVLFVGADDFEKSINSGVQFSQYFSEYPGSNDVEEIMEYMRDLYKDTQSSSRQVFYHVVPSATDRAALAKVWIDVGHMMITAGLRRG